MQGWTHKHPRVKYVWTGRYVNSRPSAAVTSTLARHSVKCSNISGSSENKVAARHDIYYYNKNDSRTDETVAAGRPGVLVGVS